MSTYRSRGVRRTASVAGVFLAVVILCGLLPGAVVAAGDAGAASTGGPYTSLPSGQFQVTASCTLSDTEAPPGTSITLDASGSEGSDSYEYDKEGDGSYESGFVDNTTYTFTYEESGTYTPTVRAWITVEEESDTAECGTLVIDENQNPNAQLDYSPTNPAPGETVTFDPSATTDADGDDIVEYQYDITGDPEYETFRETDAPVEHTYQEPGTYTVYMRARDEHGAYGYTSVNVTVEETNDPPFAYFFHDPEGPLVGETVTFDARESYDPDGSIAEFRWDFDGDGVTDRTVTGDEPVVTDSYASPGTYNAALTVVDDDGATTRYTDNVTVREPAQLSCTVQPGTVTPGEEVTVDATGSEGIETMDVDIDGDESYELTNVGLQTTYAYDEPGTYIVLARAETAGGTEFAECGTVTVEEPNDAPFAYFVYDPQGPAAGETVTFDARESYDPDGSIAEFRWDFDGDGVTDRTAPGDEPVVTGSYASPGTYNATLTVVDGQGATGTHSETIEVQESARLACSVQQEAITPGEEVTVDATTSEDIETMDVDVDGDESYELTNVGLQTTYAYDEPGTYIVLARAETAGGTEFAECGSVEVNEPPDAAITLSPSAPQPGDTVTLDASGSFDPDGTVTEYRWDFDGDGTTDRTTDGPQTSLQYDDGTVLEPRVTVVDDLGATDTATARPREVVAVCEVSTDSLEPGDTVTIDARGSEGGYVALFDVDGDGTFERESSEFYINYTYEEAGEFAPRVRVVGELGNDTTACTELVVGGGPAEESDDPGLPLDPLTIGGGLAGLGGGYYAYRRYTGGSDSRPPRPPTDLPDGHGLKAIETGTFRTPVGSETVQIGGLGFEPDLILLSATTTRGGDGSGGGPDRTDGWAHGRVHRGENGQLLQSTVALADDGKRLDGGMGGATDGHALELLVHYDDPPERLLGSVTATTSDGFEMTFDADGLRGDRADAQFTVLYKAFGFSGDPQIEVGHFRTPDAPGTQSVQLGIDADHVMLFATNTVDDVDSHVMTDLPLGFSVGDVIGRGTPAQQVRTATMEPSVPGTASYAAYDDRALHLLYGYDGHVRGRTTARATNLGTQLDLEYESVYTGPNKLGSTDSKLVSYVAMNTGGVQPAVGFFQLPDPGEDELLAVDLGFQPSMIEFQTFGLTAVNTETTVTSPLSFGWSDGTVIPDDGDLRHQMLDETVTSAVSGGVDGLVSPGVAASVRTVADGGRITGRDDVTVTAFTETGFELLVTDLATGSREGEDRPYVFYKAWPLPVDANG